jgi:hypothetical protein
MATIETRRSADGITGYRAKVRLKGFPSQSATFERKTDAKEWAKQTEASIREGRYFKTTEAKKHTIADFIDRYLREIEKKTPSLVVRGLPKVYNPFLYSSLFKFRGRCPSGFVLGHV